MTKGNAEEIPKISFILTLIGLIFVFPTFYFTYTEGLTINSIICLLVTVIGFSIGGIINDKKKI